MKTKTKAPASFTILEGDLDRSAAVALEGEKYLQIDTETDGLNWRYDKLRAVTITSPDNHVVIVKNPIRTDEDYLRHILTNNIGKYFHHAYFDLCFIKACLDIEVQSSIYCTKILMKIIHPELPSGLGSALRSQLGVKINKHIEHNKWKNNKWSSRQKQYMANDTLYLYDLHQSIVCQLWTNQYDIYFAARAAMIRKSILDVEGYTDLLIYAQDPAKQSKKLREWWENRKKEIYQC